MEKITLTNGTIIEGEIINVAKNHGKRYMEVRLRHAKGYEDKRVYRDKIEKIEGEIV